MPDESTRMNRRTVLRTTGTLLAGTALATAPAAAQLQPGDCANVLADVTAYEEACPPANPSTVLEASELVQVLDSCVDAGGIRWVQVARRNKFIGVWVQESYLTFMPCS